jgi:hypothetical protein
MLGRKNNRALTSLPSSGVAFKSSWLESVMKDVYRLDMSRTSSIDARYKKAADGTMKEVFLTFKVDDREDRTYSIHMKHFLEAVQKHTMGETGKASEIFVDHEDVVKLTGTPPKSNVLKSEVGRFANETEIKILGLSAASAYCNLTLNCIYKYIDKGSIFKPAAPGYCMMHGGLAFPDKDVFQRCVEDGMNRIQRGEHIKSSHVVKTASFNDVHRLGFGGSVITGRLGVPDACNAGTKALEAMHPLCRTTVVGHTPQWLGIPTIIRESGYALFKYNFLVVLDTQFSDRQKNTHSLGLFKDGSFCLRGSWMNYMTYTARSDDVHIGRKIKITSNGFASSTPYFRVIAKSENETPSRYIAVNYEPNPTNPVAVGETTVCLVYFERDASKDQFVAKVTPPEAALVEATKKKFITSGTVELEEDHMFEKNPIDNSMSSSKMELGYNSGGMWNFERFVCGDIESSVDFLHAFLMHSYIIAHGKQFSMDTLRRWKEQWKNGSLLLTMFGLKDDNSLGFDAKTISDAMKEVMIMSHFMVMKMEMKFACIGDVIGDPVGKGNLFKTDGTELVHEFMCVHWANEYCLDKIIGNRDFNKLRFLQEIPYILKPENRTYFELISQLQQEFARNNTTNTVTLKRLLGHFCYPYSVGKGSAGEEVKLSKHFLFDPAKPILPFRKGVDGTNDYPPTIWEAMP